jgi:hypothetical protein
MNIYVTGTAWVLGVAAVAAVATILVHRLSSSERNANDSITGVFTIVAGLQAVLMAFVLISLFDTARSITEDSYTEANALVAVHWASDSLPPPARDEIQELARSYARTVADQEWPSQREGAPVAGPGSDLLERMRVAIDGAPADGDWQQERKSEAASQLWAVYEARQARMNAAGDGGVTTVVWLVLVVGSVLSIALPYLFDVPKLITHMVIVGTLAATIALLMFSIYQLQNPFSGVEPDAFDSAFEQMLERVA